MIATEELILKENPALHDFVSKHLNDMPDFSESFRVKERWTNLNATTATWDAIYRELVNVGEYSDVLTVMNGAGKGYSVTASRINDFIEKFPTLLWTSLLQPGLDDSGALRLLLKANRMDFVDSGKTLLMDEGRRVATPIVVWPMEMSSKLVSPIITTTQLDYFALQYSPAEFTRFVNTITVKRLAAEVSKGRPNWGLFFIALSAINQGYPITIPRRWIELVETSNVRWPSDLIDILAKWFESFDTRIGTRKYDVNELFRVIVGKSYPTAIHILIERAFLDIYSLRFSTLEVAKAIYDGASQTIIVHALIKNYDVLEPAAVDYLARNIKFARISIVLIEFGERDTPLANLEALLKIVIEYLMLPVNVLTSILHGTWIPKTNKPFPTDLDERIDLLCRLDVKIDDVKPIEELWRHRRGPEVAKLLSLYIRDTVGNRELLEGIFRDATDFDHQSTAIAAAKTGLVRPETIDSYMTTFAKTTKTYKLLCTARDLIVQKETNNT